MKTTQFLTQLLRNETTLINALKYETSIQAKHDKIKKLVQLQLESMNINRHNKNMLNYTFINSYQYAENIDKSADLIDYINFLNFNNSISF